jgi:membrane protease YdiL (CAAX protease family)
MGKAIDGGKSLKLRVRLLVAIAGELVYLFGRSVIIASVGDRFLLEVVWTAWRLAFVLFYLWLFFDVVKNQHERRPIPRDPLFGAFVVICLAVVPFATTAWSTNWREGLLDLVAVPIVALREELFYRAIVQRALGRVLPPLGAIVVATLLFAMSHVGAQPINLVTLSSFVAGGVVLGVVYHHTRNLWIAVALHAAADFLVWLPHIERTSADMAVIGNIVAIVLAVIWWSKSSAVRRVGI